MSRWHRAALQSLAAFVLTFTLAMLLSACASECLTDCGLRSDTADCAELQRAETATVRGYAAINVPSCEHLRGYSVIVKEPTMTSGAGKPCWPDARFPNYECIYGYTDCARHGIVLAYLGILPHEVGHVLDGCATTHEEMALKYGAAQGELP